MAGEVVSLSIPSVPTCLRELCQMDACCQILRMIEEADNSTLKDLDNECMNLDIICDRGMNQQYYGEHKYVNRISSETVPKCFYSLNKSFPYKIKPMVSHMTEPMASSKKDMQWNENPQMNPHERVKKATIKKGRKESSIWNQFLQ
ncbi:hypothetical protein ACTXT7_002989 [Hymenolepis weldensis]